MLSLFASMAAYLILIGILMAVCSQRLRFTGADSVFFSLVCAWIMPPLTAFCVMLITRQYCSMSTCLVIIGVFIGLSLFALMGLKSGHQQAVTPQSRIDTLMVLSVVPLGIGFFFYYTNTQFILSLGSYIMKGDAECFYMQSLAMYDLLHPLRNAVDLQKLYSIISTPLNSAFTGPLVPIFKLYAFHVVYILTMIILYMATFLLLKEWIKNPFIALVGALFSVGNPYMLSIEILDRNVIALTLATVLLYVITRAPRHTWVHGMLMGILAGTGLRCMPLLYGGMVLSSYVHEKRKGKDYAVLLLTSGLVFCLTVPHLFYNGFHSLGETRPWYELLRTFIMEPKRSPFVPLPTLFYYGIKYLSYMGYLVAGLICMGCAHGIRHDRIRTIGMLMTTGAYLLVLGIQVDWIEGDKYRILVACFLPFTIFLCWGMQSCALMIRERKNYIRNGVLLSLPFLLTVGIAAPSFPLDPDTYHHKSLAFQESTPYARLLKKTIFTISLFPDYTKLGLKFDYTRKRYFENEALQRLFSPERFSSPEAPTRFYQTWEELLRSKPYHFTKPLSYISLELDLNQLVTDPTHAVRIVSDMPLATVDLENKEELFDVYYTALTVPWQDDPLTMTLFNPCQNESDPYELVLSLQAFEEYGKDNLNLPIISPVYRPRTPEFESYALKSGLQTFPLFEEKGKMFFRIPSHMPIIVSYWILNASKGTPYRVDSWIIRYKNNEISTLFFINEPESYL